jgi:hypothetical protein
MYAYTNGIIYGIKTSIKLFSKIKNNKISIKILCDLQNHLITKCIKFNNDNNITIWREIENFLDF